MDRNGHAIYFFGVSEYVFVLCMQTMPLFDDKRSTQNHNTMCHSIVSKTQSIQRVKAKFVMVYFEYMRMLLTVVMNKRGFNSMRTGGIIILWLVMLGLTLTVGYTPIQARDAMVVPTSAIVPPTFTPTVSPTAGVATNTVVPTSVPSGNTSGTQTAVVAVTQTAIANQNLTTTPTATTVRTATAIIIVITNTPQPTQTQPGRLPNTGIIDGIEVWQNQPLVVVMAVTGLLGLAFLFYGQRN